MRVQFSKPLPAGFTAELEYGKGLYLRNDMLPWLRENFGARYYTECAPYSYETGRKSWGKRASDGRRCLVAEIRHVPAGGMYHDIPSLETLVKMRAKRDGVAAIIRADDRVFWAAVVNGKLVTRSGVAA